MEFYTPILTIATFALYTFIFSLFIVPPLKDLRQIRAGLRGLIKPKPLLKEKENDDKRKEQRKRITDTLKDYKLRHQEIRQSTRFLIWGGIATVIATLLLFIATIPGEENVLPYVFNNTELLIFVVYITVILILMIVAFITQIPSPRRITEWSYLVKNYGLSPSGLAECADFKIDFNPRNKSLFEQHDPKEKRPIQIFSDIELRGYKYWFFIHDLENETIVLNLVGVIDKTTNLNERFLDLDDLYGWSATVGEFDAYKFRGKKLQMHFFIFDPILYSNVGEPYWGYNNFTYDGRVSWSSGHNVSLQPGTYSKIKYYGNGLKFNKLEWYKYEDDFPKKDFSEVKSSKHWNIVEKVFEVSHKSLLKNIRYPNPSILIKYKYE